MSRAFGLAAIAVLVGAGWSAHHVDDGPAVVDQNVPSVHEKVTADNHAAHVCKVAATHELGRLELARCVMMTHQNYLDSKYNAWMKNSGPIW
jgi:hypothetical protein